MKRFSGITTWFLPFAFAMVLSWLTVWNREAAAPAFYSFLPMTFFFGRLSVAALVETRHETRGPNQESGERSPGGCRLTRACSGLAHRLRLFARR